MGLEFGEDLQRAVGPAGHVPTEFAGEHAAGGGERALGAGVDQVGHRLGLREVDAAREVGATRELAGFGDAAAAREAIFGDPAHEQRIAVAGDLERVVTRERAASMPEHGDDLIDGLAVLVAPDTERRGLLGERGLASEGGRCDGRGQGAVDAHDGQGRAAGGCRGGDDGLGGGHRIA